MTMLQRLFPNIEPTDVVVRRAYAYLLEPMRTVCPEACQAVLKAWDAGQPCGPALADTIRAWGEQIRAEGKETAKKLYARCEAQEKQLSDFGKEYESLRKETVELHKHVQVLRELITEKEETIQSQNNLLVKLHEQFSRLLGSPKDE